MHIHRCARMVLGDHAPGFEGPLIDFFFFCGEHMDKTVKENTLPSITLMETVVFGLCRVQEVPLKFE